VLQDYHMEIQWLSESITTSDEGSK
jgi:hypothetical protein